LEYKEGLTFDDVLLVPKYSNITSRSQTNLSTKLSRNISLNIPFISANMDTVTESEMAVAMAREGGIGIIHRFLSIEDEVKEVLKVKRSGSVMIENPYTIKPDQTVSDAINYAQEQGVSGLLVTDSELKLVGILTDRDLIFETDLSKLVKDVMTKDVITAKPGISLEDAKELLHKHRIEKLPLIDDSKHVKGLICKGFDEPLEKIIYNLDNDKAKQWKNEFLQDFGTALANVIDILDPDVIVLGGGVSNISFLYDEGKKSVYEKVFSDLVDTPILQNKLGDSAGVFGACLF